MEQPVITLAEETYKGRRIAAVTNQRLRNWVPDGHIDGTVVDTDNKVSTHDSPENMLGYLRELVDDIDELRDMYEQDSSPKTWSYLDDELTHGRAAAKYALHTERFLYYDWDDLVLELRNPNQ